MSGISRAAPRPRIEAHSRAPPTGTIENDMHKCWRRRQQTQETMVLGCQARLQRGFLLIQSASRNSRCGNNKVEDVATLNDAWPRVHGQVVVIILQVVKDAPLHQRLVDAFLEDFFEVCLRLLIQANLLID